MLVVPGLYMERFEMIVTGENPPPASLAVCVKLFLCRYFYS